MKYLLAGLMFLLIATGNAATTLPPEHLSWPSHQLLSLQA
jgi:hypothetical protein